MGVCWECEREDDCLHAHHVVPRSRGGQRTVDLCESCHGKAHNHNMKISALTRAGMARRRAEGKHCGGKIPYGFILSDDGETLLPNAHERGMMEAARILHRAGYSLRKIAAVLQDTGYKPRNGNRFHASTIKRFIESDWILDDE